MLLGVSASAALLVGRGHTPASRAFWLVTPNSPDGEKSSPANTACCSLPHAAEASVALCPCHAVPPPSPVLADPVIRSGLANFHFAISGLCLDDFVQDRIQRPRRRKDGPVLLTLDIFCQPAVCLYKYLYAFFFHNFPCPGPGQGLPDALPVVVGPWTGLSALAAVESGPLGLPHHTKEPLLILNPSVFSISPFGFIAQRRICLGHLRDIPYVQHAVRCAEFIMASGADAKLDRRTAAESTGGRHT